MKKKRKKRNTFANNGMKKSKTRKGQESKRKLKKNLLKMRYERRLQSRSEQQLKQRHAKSMLLRMKRDSCEKGALQSSTRKWRHLTKKKRNSDQLQRKKRNALHSLKNSKSCRNTREQYRRRKQRKNGFMMKQRRKTTQHKRKESDLQKRKKQHELQQNLKKQNSWLKMLVDFMQRQEKRLVNTKQLMKLVVM